MKKVLIYGDSNTWGDNFITGVRIDDDKQWPNILQNNIGMSYKIIQEGLPGRSAGNCEIEKKYKNGKDVFLSTFRTVAPIDILLIALGTNDLQLKYNRKANEIINDLVWYTEVLEEEFSDIDNQKKYFSNMKMPKIIYILPPNFDYMESAKNIFNEECEQNRKEIIKYFENNKNKYTYIIPKEMELFEDGIHFNYNDHKKMAELVESFLIENE